MNARTPANTLDAVSRLVTQAVLLDIDGHIRDEDPINVTNLTVTRRSHDAQLSIPTCGLMTRIGNPIPRRTPLAFLPFRDVLTWDAGMSVMEHENVGNWTMNLMRAANCRPYHIRHRPLSFTIPCPDHRRHQAMRQDLA